MSKNTIRTTEPQETNNHSFVDRLVGKLATKALVERTRNFTFNGLLAAAAVVGGVATVGWTTAHGEEIDRAAYSVRCSDPVRSVADLIEKLNPLPEKLGLTDPCDPTKLLERLYNDFPGKPFPIDQPMRDLNTNRPIGG